MTGCRLSKGKSNKYEKWDAISFILPYTPHQGGARRLRLRIPETRLHITQRGGGRQYITFAPFLLIDGQPV